MRTNVYTCIKQAIVRKDMPLLSLKQTTKTPDDVTKNTGHTVYICYMRR